MPLHQPQLYPAELSQLRPTQITVGLAEVETKQSEWRGMRKSERQRFLEHHWFPAVRGPKGAFFIVDHHHLGRALLDLGVQRCQVVQLADLSALAPDEFWVVMDMHQWLHPYDAKGRRRKVSNLPHSLEGLSDDPYRSLAGAARRAGGFPKDATPFAEFMWADFFRRRVAATLLRQDATRALEQALNLCHGAEASYLPGWTGIVAPLLPSR